MRSSVMLSAVLMLGMAVPAVGQTDACGLTGLASSRKPGVYALYKLEGGEAAGGTLRLTLIGTEKKAGVARERVEMQMTSPRMGGGPMIIQMVVPAWPFASSEIGEMVMQAPGQPPMRMSAQMMGMMNQRGGGMPAMNVDKTCQDAKLVGTEKLTVAGGSFETQHYRNTKEGVDLWISPTVSGWGLVKSVGQGTTMTLTGMGKDGKTALTGEPMEMPMGMPNRR